MLLKEIKDRILKIVYDSAEHTQLSIDDFAKEIPEATKDQLVKAGDSLNQSSMFATYILLVVGLLLLVYRQKELNMWKNIFYLSKKS